MTKREQEKELHNYPAALDVKEVAEILRVSTKTVYNLINSKQIPSVKVGRENRIAKSHLINFILHGSKNNAKRSEKSSKKRWTCEPLCGIVLADDKIRLEGEFKYVEEENVCSKCAS